MLYMVVKILTICWCQIDVKVPAGLKVMV